MGSGGNLISALTKDWFGSMLTSSTSGLLRKPGTLFLFCYVSWFCGRIGRHTSPFKAKCTSAFRNIRHYSYRQPNSGDESGRSASRYPLHLLQSSGDSTGQYEPLPWNPRVSSSLIVTVIFSLTHPVRFWCVSSCKCALVFACLTTG